MYCKIGAMKKILCIIFVFGLITGLFAQNADVVTEILESEKVYFGQISYLTAVRQKLVDDKATYQQALDALKAKGQVKPYVTIDQAVTYAEICSLYLKIWPNAKGGFMYRLTNGAPRYAFIYLTEEGLIDSHIEPSDNISGQAALNLLTDCMDLYGTDEECMTMNIEKEKKKKEKKQKQKKEKVKEITGNSEEPKETVEVLETVAEVSKDTEVVSEESNAGEE